MTAIIFAVVHHLYYYGLQKIGLQVKVATSGMLVKKGLSLSNSALRRTTVGHVVNLLSTDVNKFDVGFVFIHHIWVSPLLLVVYSYYLWKEIGPSAFAGKLLVNVVMRSEQIFRKEIANRADKRLSVMNEILNGIRMIKMYVWEDAFTDVVGLTISLVRIIDRSICTRASRVGLYNSCRLSITLFFPFAVQFFFELRVTLKRIQVSRKLSVHYLHPPYFQNNRDDAYAVKDLTFEANSGDLIAVVGPVGSGKSSLLSSLLCETHKLTGKLIIDGKIAYCNQDAWIFNGTVRDNILFGCDYDQKTYHRALELSALSSDIEQFPHGDAMVVGDRGTSLSGGQRARISLARAIYSNADIFLLDDPLSAVDATVARHLFDRCICGYLRNKVVVLVTHQIQFLHSASKVLLMKKGEVKYDLFNSFNNSLLCSRKSLYFSHSSIEEIVLTIYRAVWFRFCQTVASINLYRRMFNAVINTKVIFFDKNPIGKCFVFVVCVFRISHGCFEKSFPYHFVPGILFLARSPLYSHISAFMNGLSTVRAFRRQKKNMNTAAFALTLSTSRWFAICIDSLVAFFVTAVAFFSIPTPGISGDVALILVYAVQLIGFFSWIMRQSADLQNGMVSIERIIQYTELESEHDNGPLMKVPAGWPTEGHIIVGLKFSFSQIGIVGRTGSGKSSLLRALFRLTAPSLGTITIDDVDTALIPLKVFSNLTICISDYHELLWNFFFSSQKVLVKKGLYFRLAFQVGQRQLVCLARALLRNSRILVIDEATANVDPRTDTLIQRTIRESFSHATVLTIAHRLHTIVDANRILVLKDGEVAEFAPAYELLQNPSGVLASLVKETGQENATLLHKVF
ncbi:unnamed protein product [Angiostrongylus costaricensis]|uniref:Multidrug resistance-associated protein lethal(2)03659 n=1 Tax=Angiostrongylus costaricensis TaxID=334426 RepID=A0A0R3PCM8_ANGCS|nr:unnamed protein product [Angiostrongylus costaricensis]